MTISSTPTELAYAGDGVSTVFPITFVFDTEADIKVVETTSGNPVVVTTGFSITGGGGAGGSLTRSVALPVGTTLTIIDDPEFTQVADYVNNDAFPAETHEDALDRGVRISKRLLQLVEKSARVPDGDPAAGAPMLFPTVASRRGTFAYWADDDVAQLEPAVTLPANTPLSQSIIGALLYPQTTAESNAGVTPTDYSRVPGDVRRYGAAMDGVTNDTVAFQRAALSSLNPYAPPGDTVLSTSVDLRDEQAWTFDGTVINAAGMTVAVFLATAVDDWSFRGDLTVVGDNNAAGSTSGTLIGLRIIDCKRFRVEGFKALSIKGWGILVEPGSSTTPRAEHGQIVAPHCHGCYIGIELKEGTGSEYVAVVAPVISRCNQGMSVAAGNCSIVGGSITDCTTNVFLGAGTNHGHGVFDGVMINHGVTYNVNANQVTIGFTFANCHIFDGDIWLDRCKGVNFRGGYMDPGTIIVDTDGSSGPSYMTDNYWSGVYSVPLAITSSTGGTGLLVIMRGWGPGAYIGGVSVNDPSPVYVHARRNPGSTQSLVSGTPTTLIFNTETNDRRAAYDNATGVFTVPAGQAGMYRIKANTIFTGTAMSTTASHINVMVNAAAIAGFFPAIFGTTILSHSILYEAHLAAGDTVSLQGAITGTTPVFGNATYAPTLVIERVA